MRGRGIMTASFSRNADGSKRIARVPARHGRRRRRLEGQQPEQRPHEHPQHGAAEAVVVGQPIAQPDGERQDPLANRQAAEHAVDQVRGALAHAPAAACPSGGETLRDRIHRLGAQRPSSVSTHDG